VLLKLDLVSPFGQLIKDLLTDKVTVSSVKGQLTILSEHREMFGLLDRGLLFIDGVNDKYIVYSGFLQILKDGSVTIVADNIRKTSELDVREIQTSIKEIEHRLNNESLDDNEYRRINSQYLDRLCELNALGQ